jgi:hypothetical protein
LTESGSTYNAAHALVAKHLTAWTKVTTCKGHISAADTSGRELNKYFPWLEFRDWNCVDLKLEAFI